MSKTKARLGNLAVTGGDAAELAERVQSVQATAAANRGELLRSVALDSLRRSPWQPRQAMGGEALEELAESIRSRGILEPLLARELEGGALEMLAGERRLEAARLAGLSSVPVRVLRDLSDADAREVALVENLAREDLTPWEEAHALAALREARKAEGKPTDVRALAGVAGRGKTKAAELLAIADALTPAVVKLAGPLVRTPDKLPHEALYGAAKGATERERGDLLARYGTAVAPAREAANREKRARAARQGGKPYTVQRGAEGKVSVAIRRPVEELDPEDAAALLDQLRPIMEALEARAGLTNTNRQG
jgi:ParB family chromosome partitioning protein